VRRRLAARRLCRRGPVWFPLLNFC
jgi:hypothetical protein